MPERLKESGFDMVFRIFIIAPFYYEKVYGIFRYRKDPVMAKRIDATMKGSIAYLFAKVCLVWAVKLFRDSKAKIVKGLVRIKWHNNGMDIEALRDVTDRIDFDCIMMADKFEKVFSDLRSDTYKALCRHGLKPLFIFFGKRYSVKREDNGYIMEIPFQYSVFPRYTAEDALLLKDAEWWTRGLDAPWLIRRKIINKIRNNFPQYVYLKRVAFEILNTGKARCVLTFAENHINYRIFIWEAKKRKLATVLYHLIVAISISNYKKYYSDTVAVCNEVQYRNFLGVGYTPERCHITGSFGISKLVLNPPVRLQPTGKRRFDNILYFTKGTKTVDEAILDELIEKLRTLNIDFSLIIKKHPKDTNEFRRFKNARVSVTSEGDFMGLARNANLIISQYSGVLQSVIPLRTPTVIYTYSDILDYGERTFFRNAQLPNYLKHVEDKQGFHRAIEELLNMKEPDALPERFSRDLYGYMDINCGRRIAELIGSFVNERQEARQEVRV